MKKGIVIALLVAFTAFAAGIAFATINADGTMTVNKDAKTFPAKKLNADGTKKKNPVTFNHAKHGKDLGCKACHHQQADLTAENAATTKVKSCFECHGPEAKDKQLDAFELIHGKTGKCVQCHKDAKAKDAASKAPTACKECHGGAE